MRFVERCKFSSDLGEVWSRVADLGAIPAYWHGTKEFRVTSEGGKTRADVVFAFGGKGSAEVPARRSAVCGISGPEKSLHLRSELRVKIPLAL